MKPREVKQCTEDCTILGRVRILTWFHLLPEQIFPALCYAEGIADTLKILAPLSLNFAEQSLAHHCLHKLHVPWRCCPWFEVHTVLASHWCCYKPPQTWGLKTTHMNSFTILGVGSLKPFHWTKAGMWVWLQSPGKLLGENPFGHSNR